MPRSRAETDAALRAVLAKYRGKPPPSERPLWDEKKFPQQAEFIQAPEKQLAILATARAAKSFSIGLRFMDRARRQADYNGLYITKTYAQAREIMWDDVVKQINYRGKLGAKFNESRLSVTLPSGGRFRLVGMDQSAEEVWKVAGTKLDDVALDEAGAFRQDLRRMCDLVLSRRLVDKRGTLILCGTPTDISNGYFYDITTGKEKGWRVWHWKAENNPYIRKQWLEDKTRRIAENPLIVHTPRWRQMVEGEWVVDQSNLVYRFSRESNYVTKIPEGRPRRVLGVDFGWRDPTAFVVLAYFPDRKETYVEWSEKESELNFDQVAGRIKNICRTYDIHEVVGDGANRQGIETINQRYGLGIQLAQKPGKHDFQQLMNADFLTGRLLVVQCAATEPLVKEWEELVWDDRDLLRVPKRYTEHPRLPNHAADAALYGWRTTHGYAARLPEPGPPAEGSPLWLKAQLEAAVRRQGQRTALASDPFGLERELRGGLDGLEDGASPFAADDGAVSLGIDEFGSPITE